MRTLPSHKAVPAIAVGMSVLTLVLFGAVHGFGQQPSADGAGKRPIGPKTKLYFGVSECTPCHSNPDRYKDAPPTLCTCNEASIWQKLDKHKDAYVNLFKERGRQITDILQYKKADIENNCVTCHGVRVENEKLKHPSFKAEDGVSCVACHGPYAEWVDLHGGIRRFEWRKKTRTEKENDFGMTDLWDPARRTRKCASCHIGNIEEGKLITHAMYAAGHPPLPGFEVSTFSEAMPKHWKYLSEKSAETRKILEYNPAVLEKTQLAVIGGVVELEESMNLLAALAERSTQAKDAGDRALDFAAFDCYACHHDLKTPSWRQARGYTGKPGRPQFRPWPTALAPLGMHEIGGKTEWPSYQQRENSLHAIFNLRPFGDPVQVAIAARDLQNWCRQIEDRLNRAPGAFNQAAARQLLQKLCTEATQQTPDYDSARQLAWAFRLIYEDLMPKPANNAAIQEKLEALNQELHLNLPAGQQQQILSELPSILSKIANYDPAPVKKLFGELSDLLHSK